MCLFHLFQKAQSHRLVLLLYISNPLVASLVSLPLFLPFRTVSSEGEPVTFLKQIWVCLFFPKSEASPVYCYLRRSLTLAVALLFTTEATLVNKRFCLPSIRADLQNNLMKNVKLSMCEADCRFLCSN